MMMKPHSFFSPQQALTFLLATSCSLPSVLATLSPSSREYCVWACNDATSYVSFATADPDPLALYLNQCGDELYVESLAYCVQKYCTEQEAEDGWKLQSDVCVANAGVDLPDLAEFRHWNDDLAEVEEADMSLILESAEVPLETAVVVSQETHAGSLRTVAAYFGNRALAYKFVWGMYGFWGLAIVIGLVNRVATTIAARRQTTGSHRAGSNSISVWIRRRLLLPATIGQHCQNPIGWCTIPPRLESLLLVLYLIMDIVFMFPGYDLFAGNLWFPTYQLQLTRYLGDRAGLLAIAQLPVVWVFAARNDPLLWITGWSYATYNRFHRWIARLCLVNAIIHSVTYTVYTVRSGPEYYVASWMEEYWYCGAISIVILSTIVVTSVYIFRSKLYDVFLVLHIALAIVIVVALWHHLKVMDDELYGFLWVCIAVWAFDRFLRLARTIYFGVIPRFIKGAKAQANYVDDSEIIRLDVTDMLLNTDISPGHYYYLYTPGNITGYQSHPFTLCSWNRSTRIGSHAASTTEDDKEAQTSAGSSSTSVETSTMHSLLIRPYNGFTRRLQKRLQKRSDSDSSAAITVFLEGPYGHKTDLRAFSNVLMIVGGNGITSAISHSNFLLQTQKTSVHVVWAVQDTSLVDNVCAHEVKEALDDPHFSLTVYKTRTSGEKLPAGAPPSYAVNHGRPDIEATIRDARQKCFKTLAVVTCGPTKMADNCRAAIVKILGESGPRVEYFNESLGW